MTPFVCTLFWFLEKTIPTAPGFRFGFDSWNILNQDVGKGGLSLRRAAVTTETTTTAATAKTAKPQNRHGCLLVLSFVREFLKALETTTALKRRKSSAAPRWVSDLSFHGCWLGLVVVWRLLWVQKCYLSILMARWRSRHFTAVTALGPQEVELEHSKVVVSWLL